MNAGNSAELSYYKTAIESVLVNQFQMSKDEILIRKNWSLDELAIYVGREIKKHLIRVHPIYEIVEKFLDDVVMHTNAIVRLQGSPAIMLHSRHIEEITTVIKFILAEPANYNKIAWKWRSFEMVHAIRNRLINLKEPLNRELQNWVEKNICELKEWVHKDFTVDSTSSLKLWRKYSNWLHPETIKTVFESTESAASYESQEYSWNSHAVHFSPLSKHLFGLCIPEHSYEQFSHKSTKTRVASNFKTCLSMVDNAKRIRTLHATLTYISFIEMIESTPEQFERLFIQNKSGSILREYLENPIGELDVAVAVVLGKEPENPMLFKF